MSNFGSSDGYNGRVGSFQHGQDGRWHEYHGWGLMMPDERIGFADAYGRHSHTTYSPDGQYQWERLEAPFGSRRLAGRNW